MIAIDTNLVVRFLTRDDPAQLPAVNALFESGQVFISNTVLLETYWVLRKRFGLKREEIVGALRGISGLESVVLEAHARVSYAFDAVAAGLDFEDAIHLAAAQECDAFVTFDRRLLKKSSSIGGVPVRLP